MVLLYHFWQYRAYFSVRYCLNEIFAKSNYGYGQAKAIVFFIIVGVITMFQVRLTSKREVEV